MARSLKKLLGRFDRLSSSMYRTSRCARQRFASSAHHDARNVSTTYQELYNVWLKRFTSADIPEPRESAEFIFAHLFKRKTFSLIPRSSLIQPISSEDISIVNSLCEKRMERMPIQYILGEWDFFGINLKLKPPVFIPRPETEELANHVLKYIEHRLNMCSVIPSLKVLEIGCGSGGITLSLLDKLKHRNVEFVAIDAAFHAVQLTKENAQRLNLNIPNKLQIFNIELEADKNCTLQRLSPFDVIVSNPPYIQTSDMNELADEISQYEDKLALHGGKQGLDVINNILMSAKYLLSEKGSIWLEVDASHPSILAGNCTDWIVESHKDMFDKPRFCHITKEMYAS